MIVVAATSRTRHVLRTSSCSGSTTDWLAELAGRLSGSEAGMMSPVPERKAVAVSTSNEVCNSVTLFAAVSSVLQRKG